jgi:hypothetical protein
VPWLPTPPLRIPLLLVPVFSKPLLPAVRLGPLSAVAVPAPRTAIAPAQLPSTRR